MEHWTGQERGVVVGSDLLDVFPEALKRKHLARIQVVFDGGPPAVFSSHLHGSLFPLKLRDGRARMHHTTVSGLAREDGQYDAMFVVQDVTSLSEQVQKLREAKRLRERVDQAQRVESLGVLAGGIAHDFNNVLASLLLSADLALTEVTPGSEAAICLQEVLTAGKRGADLAKQMLAYAGKASVVAETVDINEIVRETTDLLRASVSRHIDLAFDLDSGGLWAEVGTTQFRQVLMNLVVNAAEAIGDVPGGISIRTAGVSAEDARSDTGVVGRLGVAESLLMIEVSDTGPGFPRNLSDRFFEPFFSTKAKGRGLGLAAVQGIVDRYHGGVSLSSCPGQRTRFRIYLPRVQKKPVEVPPVDEIPRHEIIASGAILVIEDEEPVRRSTKLAIQRLGFEVLEAVDGPDGIRVFESRRDDVAAAVVDFVMPGANGVEVLTRLRELKPGLPALFVSGYSELGDIDLFSTGPTELLPKPFDLDTLRRKLLSVLAQQSDPGLVLAGHGELEGSLT
jgi:two-component system, cell cycle sensor histidine kinase and response regulator CckA